MPGRFERLPSSARRARAACNRRRSAYSGSRALLAGTRPPYAAPPQRAAGTPARIALVTNTAIREAIERDEAAAAEVETPEPEPEPDTPEPEPEPQPQPPTEKELAALGKKIDAENERHEKRLAELYGDTWADMRDCPLCMSEGFLLPVPIEHRDPAQVEAVHAALGEHEQPELRPMEGVERCPKCDGWGHVATPSRNPENKTKPCLGCETRGYREVIPGQDQWVVPAPVVQTIGNGYAPPPVYGEVDAWNRPAGHPHYNIAPADVR